MNSTHRLLVRPSPFPDEWWTGYLMRLAARNGIHWRSEFFRTAVAEHFANELGVEIDHAHWHGTSPQLNPASTIELPAWSRYHGWRSPLICLACWQQTPYFRMQWRLRGYCACLEHGRLLVPFHGVDLDATPIEPLMGQFEPNCTVSERGLDRDRREVLQGIWGPISAKGGVDNEVVLATFYSKMLTVVAAARRGKDRDRPSTDSLELVTDWLTSNRLPPPFHDIQWGETFIKQLTYPVHKAALVRFFDRTLANADCCYSRLPIGRWRALAAVDAGPIHGRGAGGGTRGMLRGFTGVPANELRRRLGINHNRMARWIRRLGIQPVALVGARCKFSILSLEDAATIAELARRDPAKPTARMQALARLGLTKRRNIVRRLVQAHQLEVAGRGANREFLENAPDKLLAALEGTALPIAACPQDSIPLDNESLYHNVWTGPIEELYEDLKSGAEKVFRHDSKQGLARFAVPISVLTRLSRRTADFARNRRRDPRQLELPHVGSTTAVQR